MFRRILRLVRATGRNAVVLWYVCRHRATPKVLKLLAALLMLYIVSPIDLLPDWIPVLGWLDDATLLVMGITALLRRVPADVLRDAEAAAAGFFARTRLQ